ncbi:SAM-dependent methyltransferase [Pseudonocardia endophytica]|uniref:S-adenosyl methyltransferase n=1 Tax=Pseudonocardia endophytica TaxID=401976 RepID=A0A4R1I294_PSEEN|nr:SAM-dependent methyltransferase [Pseudonocardia endophytica]TCK27400.1 S-adenosyl methyltransferase [Pseudonocardia endophytica]
MTDRPSWAPEQIDMERPSVARVYDYYLGGSHNFDSDREFAAEVLRVLPEMSRVAQDNRAFLRRAVRFACHSGVDQFIDLGSGIPTVGNVHEVAGSILPRATVVYVDHDPVAVAHSREILQDEPDAVALSGDLTAPGEVLDDPVLRSRIDFSRPVCILFVSVLHFVGDEWDPAGVVAGFAGPTVPGSLVALSHASTDGGRAAVDAQAVYNRDRSPNPMRMRTRAEIEALFGTLELVEPGVVRIPLWRPDTDAASTDDVDRYPGYAGVARRR